MIRFQEHKFFNPDHNTQKSTWPLSVDLSISIKLKVNKLISMIINGRVIDW